MHTVCAYCTGVQAVVNVVLTWLCGSPLHPVGAHKVRLQLTELTDSTNLSLSPLHIVCDTLWYPNKVVTCAWYPNLIGYMCIWYTCIPLICMTDSSFANIFVIYSLCLLLYTCRILLFICLLLYVAVPGRNRRLFRKWIIEKNAFEVRGFLSVFSNFCIWAQRFL